MPAAEAAAAAAAEPPPEDEDTCGDGAMRGVCEERGGRGGGGCIRGGLRKGDRLPRPLVGLVAAGDTCARLGVLAAAALAALPPAADTRATAAGLR